MPLPVIPLPTGEVTVDGNVIPIRGLSRTEYLTVGQMGRENVVEAEAVILSAGTGVTIEEARAWLAATESAPAQVVLDAITDLSGKERDGKVPQASTSEP